MNELFLKIINMSISAGWLILAVLVLRFLLKRAPKWVSVLLWGVVAVRLICPFFPESNVSLMPSAETLPERVLSGPSFDIETGIAPVDDRINDDLGDHYFEGVSVPANNGSHRMTFFGILWSIGIVLLAVYTVVSYWHLHRKISTAVLYRDHIFQSEYVTSPFVFGMLRPRIYLPFKMDERELEHVIAHEQAHICRRDYWWKPLGFLLLTIHWFNPLVWLSYVLFCRDIEFACDEKVIKNLDNVQRADYTQTLVLCSIDRHRIAACPLAFGEAGVKERVKSVMNYKKPSPRVIVVSLIACVIVTICFLTNPKQDSADIKIGDDASADLEQDYTEYIGDAPKVSAIAGNLPYPKGCSYSSIELQTEREPYELMVYLDGGGSVQEEDFQSCASTAFRLIGNMGIISFYDAETGIRIASFDRAGCEDDMGRHDP